MNLVAYSLNETTHELKAAIAALRFAGHTVDLFRHQAFGESVSPYNAALISLGNFTADSAVRVKLAAARAAILLPTCYLFDHARCYLPAELFWKSAAFGSEGPSGMMHRAEMKTAIKSHWKTQIDEVLTRWVDRYLPGITPGEDWNPGPFYSPPDTSEEQPIDSARKIEALLLNHLEQNVPSSRR